MFTSIIFKEENYEIGNPRAKTTEGLTPQQMKTTTTGYKWRIKLKEQSLMHKTAMGIFSGHKIILHCSKKEQYKIIVEAGCGVVVDIEYEISILFFTTFTCSSRIRVPYWNQTNFKDITHCFTNETIEPISAADRTKIEAVGVSLVNMQYFRDCIFGCTFPAVADYPLMN